jgi:type I restriction enzyme S subunit
VQLKPGYKQTEVGVIPEEWDVSSLNDCCSKITDGTHDTPKPVQSGIPYITAIHVKDNCIDFQSCLYVTKADHDIIFSRCNPRQGDVLLVNIGAGVATTAIVDVDYECSLKNVALLKPNRRRIAGEYLNYCLADRKPKITQALSSGGAQPFLSLTQIGEIIIPLPPPEEQLAVAGALSDVDALIGALDKLIAKKRDIKQAAMQQQATSGRLIDRNTGRVVATLSIPAKVLAGHHLQ